MKVLVISGVFPPTLAAESEYAYHFLSKLRDSFSELSLLTTDKPDLARLPGVEVFPIMKRWNWSELPRLYRFLKESQPDVIFHLYIGWNYQNRSLPTFLPSLAKKISPKVRVISLFYNRYGANKPLLSWPEVKFTESLIKVMNQRGVCFEFGTLLTHSDRVICFAPKHLEFLESVYPEVRQKSEILPALPLIDTEGFDFTESRLRQRSEFGFSDEETVFAFLGFMYPSKNVELLLRAVARLKEKQRLFKLLLIGGVLDETSGTSVSYATELKALCKQLNLEDYVRWSGSYAWGSKLPSRWLSSADACVFPFSHGLSFNNSSLATALNHHLPILGVAGEKTAGALATGKWAGLCDSTESALAALMGRFITDESYRSQLRQGASELLTRYFSWEKAVSRLELMCRDTTDGFYSPLDDES